MISIPLIRRELKSDLLGRHIYLFGARSVAAEILRRLAEAGAQEGTVVLSEDRGEAAERRGALPSPSGPRRRPRCFRRSRPWRWPKRSVKGSSLRRQCGRIRWPSKTRRWAGSWSKPRRSEIARATSSSVPTSTSVRSRPSTRIDRLECRDRGVPERARQVGDCLCGARSGGGTGRDPLPSAKERWRRRELLGAGMRISEVMSRASRQSNPRSRLTPPIGGCSRGRSGICPSWTRPGHWWAIVTDRDLRHFIFRAGGLQEGRERFRRRLLKASTVKQAHVIPGDQHRRRRGARGGGAAHGLSEGSAHFRS